MTIQKLRSYLQIISKHKKQTLLSCLKVSWWFGFGAIFGFFFFVSFLYILYQRAHADKIYDGVIVEGVNFGGKSPDELKYYFTKKNKQLQKISITITSPSLIATTTAKRIDFGYNENLLADQAMSIGRSSHILSNITVLLEGYISGITLPTSFRYSDYAFQRFVAPMKKQFDKTPTDALFTFDNGRVTTFRPSQDGQRVDTQKIEKILIMLLEKNAEHNTTKSITFPLPLVTEKPAITTENVNKLGIKSLLGEGTSLFYHSIDSRIYNITLASSRLNGTLIPPGQIFSFDQTVGDISQLNGYKQAYIIENGKTVLGDGGGVCQVSTTLFRSAINAGLPIIERHQHAYRVGYYEEDSPPGIDAAIYSPTVDLKFKNDTGHYILVQTKVDFDNYKLTFDLFGTNDGRTAIVGSPIILSETPAPTSVYQDDPTLPKGETKQVDFAAGGANVYFLQTVTKNGITTSNKFISDYRPWQAIYLRGTKE